MKLLRRALWHVNRSPLAPAVQAGLGLFSLAERRERRLLARALAAGPSARERAALLNAQGYVMMGDLIPAGLQQDLMKDGLEKASRAKEIAQAEGMTNKGFWVRLLDGDMRDGALDADNLYVRYALQEPVLSVVSAALGSLPLLQDVLLTLSRDDGGAPLTYSQLWHRDHDNPRTIKVFTYLTDVSEPGDGPFTFIPGPASDGVGFTLRSHRDDEDVFRLVDRRAVKAMTAPRLATFVVETSRCLHMGSRMGPGRSRLMYTATFVRAPRVFPRPKPLFRAGAGLDAARRLVLGL